MASLFYDDVQDSDEDVDNKHDVDEDLQTPSQSGGGPAGPGPGVQVPIEKPIFVPDVDWNTTPEMGRILSAAISNDTLIVATESGSVLRRKVATAEREVISVGRKGDERIYKVFVDPTGQHALISLVSEKVLYLHASMQQPKPCSKIKDILIESIAWDKYTSNDKSTGKFLIGTRRGGIFEASLERGGRDTLTKLYDLGDEGQDQLSGDGGGVPVSGLQMERFPGSEDPAALKYFVMAATPLRQYQFIGGPTFEALFAKYQGQPFFLELPGDLNYSELQFFSKELMSRAESCAWLTGAGIYFGHLVFGSQQVRDKVMEDGRLLEYPADFTAAPLPDARSRMSAFAAAEAKGLPSAPLSLLVTQFHFLLLYPQRLVAINQLSEEIVMEENFTEFGVLKALMSDPASGSLWLYSDRAVVEVMVEDETRDVWRLYLAEHKFDQALEYCTTAAQREAVTSEQGDYFFAQGNHELAAQCYARTLRSFEEVALRFVNIHNTNALKAYLIEKLKTLKNAATQRTMICTWLTEIYLDRLHATEEKSLPDPYEADSAQELLSIYLPASGPTVSLSGARSGGPSGLPVLNMSVESAEAEFRDFLIAYRADLNSNTTFELISSHGRLGDLLFFAELMNNWEWVLSHHIQHKNYRAALTVLSKHRRPKEIEELIYKFSPALMQHAPQDTVTMLLKPEMLALDPSKLLPALMRYESSAPIAKGPGAESKEPSRPQDNQAIRYLMHRITIEPPTRDPAIHNYLLSLYAKLDDEDALIRFIRTQAVQHRNRPFFDYKYALRQCHQHGKRRACVELYTNMGLYEDAVKLALDLNLSLAKDVMAAIPSDGEDDSESAEPFDIEADYKAQDKERDALKDHLPRLSPHDKKRLWMLLARHVISNTNDIGKAMSILKQCQLRIDDILPYFPNFVKLKDFKDEICSSLEQYNRSIDGLKAEMEEYSSIAALIRKDIGELRNRSGFVTASHKCDLCRQPLLTREFLVFSCTHVFHVDCATRHVRGFLARHPQLRGEILEGLLSSGTIDSKQLAALSSARPAREEKVPASATVPQPSPSPVPPGAKDDKSALASLLRFGNTAPNAAGAAQTNQGKEAGPDRKLEESGMQAVAASECVLCGRVMIESVQEPFVLPGDDDFEAREWEI